MMGCENEPRHDVRTSIVLSQGTGHRCCNTNMWATKRLTSYLPGFSWSSDAHYDYRQVGTNAHVTGWRSSMQRSEGTGMKTSGFP